MYQPSQDVSRFVEVAARVARALAVPVTAGLPEEIVEALEMARVEMRNTGQAIDSLVRTKAKMTTLVQAIDRLVQLADEAGRLAETDRKGREIKQKEFVKLARLVAQLAGKDDYNLPQLSLITKPRARAAHSALKPLILVKDSVVRQLDEHQQNIIDAVQATVEFLQIVDQAYPDALPWIADLLTDPALHALVEDNQQRIPLAKGMLH